MQTRFRKDAPFQKLTANSSISGCRGLQICMCIFCSRVHNNTAIRHWFLVSEM